MRLGVHRTILQSRRGCRCSGAKQEGPLLRLVLGVWRQPRGVPHSQVDCTPVELAAVLGLGLQQVLQGGNKGR